MYETIRITICGAGTLGGNLAENLARLGLGTVTVIDCDRVEQKNLANQPYFSQDIGQPKVKALSSFLFRAVGVRVAGFNKKLTKENSLHLLENAGLVVDMFDNEESRRAVKETCAARRIPCVHAGISSDGYGEVIWNDRYKVPANQKGSACTQPLNRNLSLLVTAIATEAIIAFCTRNEQRNFSITLKDLCIQGIG